MSLKYGSVRYKLFADSCILIDFLLLVDCHGRMVAADLNFVIFFMSAARSDDWRPYFPI